MIIEIDLIYEGIATKRPPLLFSTQPLCIEIDLIYEGIATMILPSPIKLIINKLKLT